MAKQNGAGRKQTDWTEIRTKYVLGVAGSEGTAISYPSYATLAAEYGLSTSTISRRARDEGWKKDREAAQRAVTERVMEAVIADTAEFCVRVRNSALRTIEKVAQDNENTVMAEGPQMSVGQRSVVVTTAKEILEIVNAMGGGNDDESYRRTINAIRISAQNGEVALLLDDVEVVEGENTVIE
ncbi:hypothetical protein LF599_07460 [Pseudodesulfovibrio thermohalotolerans]|uniref:hypothetical protein n=1 Tax=Pseudodesulfovibrio thermohalotolerans TaxID=2880651 RepID=UPI002443051F|nr:hypothetical protein [Pseudodesulfovibrio thermohalotolerans]WFS63992.1 hypothetical protein LF599_07460 [Pseudodesulfovibrio thermohalotolerans]